MSGRISAMVDQRLCPCGSGLRAARCCALDLATLSPPEASRHLAPIVKRARAAFDGHDIAIAETLCLEVLELAPEREDALALLHNIRKEQGRAAAAEALARRLVSQSGLKSAVVRLRARQPLPPSCRSRLTTPSGISA